MVIESLLIVAALIAMAMVGAAFGIGAWFGARLAARLIGRDEPVFRDEPGIEIDEDDEDVLQTT